MPTYVYSPIQSQNKNNNKNNSSHSSSASSRSINSSYKRNKTPRMTAATNVANNNNSQVLRYQTVAPSIVSKKYTQRPNGGYNLSYRLQNANVRLHQKPKLRFIQLARLVSPQRLK